MDIDKLMEDFEKFLSEYDESKLNEWIEFDKKRILLYKLKQHSVDNWIEFDKNKPNEDRLFLITNGNYVEICYYENENLMKPFKYDEYDTPTFNAQKCGLMWQYIDLPIINKTS